MALPILLGGCGRIGFDFLNEQAPTSCEQVDCAGHGDCIVTIEVVACVCDDGFTNTSPTNCSAIIPDLCTVDQDLDGYLSPICGGDDCNDQDQTIYPGALEGPIDTPTCDDNIDNDCDGAVDLDDNDCTATLVEEIDQDVSPEVDQLFPNVLTIGSQLFFSGGTLASGLELWVSDGTATGTRQVKDINPAGDGTPQFFAELNGELIFVANDGSGKELWKSDGTDVGTIMLRDINPNGSSINFVQIVSINGYAVFEADDGQSGRELWGTDGTPDGTQLLMDINPGSASSSPYEIHKLSDTVAVFRATAPGTGAELWRTDGTAANTGIIVDANPGTASSLPEGWYRYFAAHQGYVYYRGTDGTNGLELWRTDGTSQGTSMVADIQPGAGNGVGSSPNMDSVAGKVFFQANDSSSGHEVFVSDGSEAGTTLLKDINPAGDSLPMNVDYLFYSFGNEVYFRASDGINDYELWKSDGSEAGTSMLRDINPNGMSNPQQLFTHKNQLYFSANDGTTGQELWVSDGTQAGTRLTMNINPGGDSWPVVIGTVNDVLLFSAGSETVRKLWRAF